MGEGAGRLTEASDGGGGCLTMMVLAHEPLAPSASDRRSVSFELRYGT